MQIRKHVLAIALALLVVPSIGLADSISGSSGDGWQAWTSSDLNENGTPYWDNTSFDGPKMNVGYCLTGTGNCGMSGAPGILPYWGSSTGAADPSIFFTSPGTSSATLQIEIAGYSGENTFGFFEIGPKSSVASMTEIFDGPASAGATTLFAPTGDYGFYLWSPDNGGTTFYTLSDDNTGDIGNQHFAIFSDGTGGYWLGMEDLSFSDPSDKDYNDMIVHIAPVSAPEPGTLGLLGMGLIALGGMARRKLSFRSCRDHSSS
jgi:hypothetical protein